VGGVQLQHSGLGPIVRFATFEVDLRLGELRKNGLKIRLQEQPFQVLAMLLKHPGEVVTREDLREAVWPQDTFVDFDHALNTAVKKIRAALGDDADNPRFLETVPRRGYRFIATVELEPAPGSRPIPTASTEPREAYRLFAIVGVVAIGLVVLGLASRVVPWHRGEDAASPDFKRLTFNLADLDEARFTADGATAVFSASTALEPTGLYSQRLDASGVQSLGMPGILLAVSPGGEMAIRRDNPRAPPVPYHERSHLLARVPLGGGSPRDLLTDVEYADWSPDGQLAVVRRSNGKQRLEFPVGKVLYESIGWIASPRFSPRGDLIAFLDHPVFPDDRGSVAVVDLTGKKRTLSSFWESERGLAWAPSGEEVWFAATRSGLGRALYAVSLSGQERRVLSIAGGLSLHDISRDGLVLLTQDNERVGIRFVGPDKKAPTDLSWHNWSMAAAISPDGKRILFGEEGENSGPSYRVGLRPTDAAPPVMLGEGVAQSLSPDGNWAISIMPPPNDQIVLLPTGAGNPRALDRGPIVRFQFERAGWFADGRQILYAGSESGHGQRCYVQDVDGGKPRALTPEGIAFCSAAPDGHVLAVTDDFRGLLYTSNLSAAPERELRMNAGEVPVGWTADSKYVYLVARAQEPKLVLRLELASGRRQTWKELPTPAANTGMKSDDVVITPDGRFFAYTYTVCQTDLYLVRGLK
jgi:DNA-binding winged helix-turn-helix (wHTH) protein/Tol biopolymer transport system component